MADAGRLVGGIVIEIEAIRRDLTGLSEDARQAAWLALYTFEEPWARRELEGMLSGADPLLKIHALRFLGSVPEERAILYIRNSLGGMNPVVVTAAQKAFDRNRYEKKLDCLLPVLQVKDTYAQGFAIDRLALAAHPGLLEPLLKLLPRAEAPLLLKILAALRHLPDKRVLDRVFPFLQDPREEVRFWAILVMAALDQAAIKGARTRLLASLADPAARIRRAILWSIRRSCRQQDLPLLFKMSHSDPDPSVRQEGVVALGAFPTQAVIRHLLRILATDKDRMVVLKGEAILIGMPPDRLAAGLIRAVAAADPTFRAKAVVLAAEFLQGSESYYRFLVGGLGKAKGDKEALPFIDALGVFGDPRAIPLLEERLHGSPLVAYAAVSALLKIGNRQTALPVLKYLQMPTLSLILKQMILRHLRRNESLYAMTDDLVAALIAFLKSDNINIRYLSSQILIRTNRETIVGPLLETVLKESDPTSLKLLRHSIVRLLAAHPHLCVQMLERHRERPEAAIFLLEVMQEAGIAGRILLEIIPSLVGEPLRLMETGYCDAMIHLLVTALVHRKITMTGLLDKIRRLEKRAEILARLAARLAAGDRFPIDLPAEVTRDWLDEEDPSQREAMIAMIGHAGGPAVTRLLVSLGCQPRFAAHHPQIASVLKEVMEPAA